MITRFLITCLLLTVPGALLAQITDIAFVGTLSVKGGAAYSYKLQLSDSDGVLQGYSITDIKGPNETKAAIKGAVNAAKNQITFRETKILSTKAGSGQQDFCFVQGRLKMTKVKGTTLLKGTYTGVQADKQTPCGSGRLVLFSAQDIMDRVMKIKGMDSLIKQVTDSVAKPAQSTVVSYEPELAASKIKTLMPGKSIELLCSAPVVNLEIWDAKTIDGDIITLEQDNVSILAHFTISGKRKNVRIDMGKKEEVTIRMVAEDEGVEPMNTARIHVLSGNDEYYIDASTTIAQSVRIMLKRHTDK